MKIEDRMIEAFCSITDKTMMKKFFDEIFTESEISDLNLRWKLLSELSAGSTQREIAKKLGVSLCKITRGAKILKDDTSVLRKFLM